MCYVPSALQESRVQADYNALLQDARLLRRDIAQAVEDREIQKARPLWQQSLYLQGSRLSPWRNLRDSSACRHSILPGVAQEDLERRIEDLGELMRSGSRYADPHAEEDAFLRHTAQHARLEEEHRLVRSPRLNSQSITKLHCCALEAR